MQSKNIFSTWLPCIQHWFSSLNSMQPFGQGWAFLPFNKPLAYFRAKMPTPALMAAYCFMRKTSSSCRATNYIQFFSLLQSFFSVYIHHISVILLNKRTLIVRERKKKNACYFLGVGSKQGRLDLILPNFQKLFTLAFGKQGYMQGI